MEVEAEVSAPRNMTALEKGKIMADSMGQPTKGIHFACDVAVIIIIVIPPDPQGVCATA